MNPHPCEEQAGEDNIRMGRVIQPAGFMIMFLSGHVILRKSSSGLSLSQSGLCNVICTAEQLCDHYKPAWFQPTDVHERSLRLLSAFSITSLISDEQYADSLGKFSVINGLEPMEDEESTVLQVTEAPLPQQSSGLPQQSSGLPQQSSFIKLATGCSVVNPAGRPVITTGGGSMSTHMIYEDYWEKLDGSVSEWEQAYDHLYGEQDHLL